MRVERKPKSADRIARDAQSTSYHVEHEAFRVRSGVHADQSGHELVVDNESRRAIVGSIYAVNEQCIIERKSVVEPGVDKGERSQSTCNGVSSLSQLLIRTGPLLRRRPRYVDVKRDKPISLL